MVACPRCSVPLSSKSAGEASLDACGDCGGLFVRRAWISSLASGSRTWTALRSSAANVESGARVAPDLLRVVALGCPICEAAMARRNFLRCSGVMVHSCPSHGTWFDRGGIDAVIRFLSTGGAERAERLEREERTRLLAAQDWTAGLDEGASATPSAEPSGLGFWF